MSDYKMKTWMIHACLCRCQVAGYKIPRRSSSWHRPFDLLLPITSKGLWKFSRQKPFELFEVKVFLFIQLSSHIKWFTVDKNEKVKVRKFVNVQQGHEYSKFFGLYVKVFQMWTSRQQNEVLNIVQTKKYPEVPTFLRVFYRTKMAEISYLRSHDR